MDRVARLLLTFLVLAFAAGAYPQATAAAHMDMPMAMSGQAGEHMPDCDECGGDPDGACFAACTLPALGAAAPEFFLRPLVKRTVQPFAAWAVIGASRPPDPYPPRLPS